MSYKGQAEIQEILPLNHSQMSILLAHLMHPGSKIYFEQQRFCLVGTFYKENIRKAWQQVAVNNEVLRSVIRWQNLRSAIQIIYKEKSIPLYFFDSDYHNGTRFSERLDERLWKLPMDLQKHLYFIVFCKITDQEYHMIVCSHHIILDGWSHSVLLREFMEEYRALCKENQLFYKAKTPLRDYMRASSKQNEKDSHAFWKNYLKDFKESEQKRTFAMPSQNHARRRICSFLVEQKRNDELKVFLSQQEITLSAFIYTAWAFFLHRKKKVEDIFFGITLSGRKGNLAGITEMAGLFIKSFFLHINQLESMDKNLILQKVNEDLLNIQNHQDIALADLLGRYSQIELDSVVVIQNYFTEENLRNDCLSIEFLSSHYYTEVELVLSVKTFFKKIEIEISYPESYELGDFQFEFLQIIDYMMS